MTISSGACGQALPVELALVALIIDDDSSGSRVNKALDVDVIEVVVIVPEIDMVSIARRNNGDKMVSEPALDVLPDIAPDVFRLHLVGSVRLKGWTGNAAG